MLYRARIWLFFAPRLVAFTNLVHLEVRANTLDGRFRGGIGSLTTQHEMAANIAHDTKSATFRSLSFTPLTISEFERVDLHISVLSAPEPLQVDSHESLLAPLHPGSTG